MNRRILAGVATGIGALAFVAGCAGPAFATEDDSPYVTVLWSYDAYPDITQPQAFVNSFAGADLHAFDATLAQGDSCGHAFQVDIYRTTLEGGVSWRTLIQDGALQYAHDGAFLAYDAVDGAPYRVVTPEEFPCAPTPTATPTSTPTAPGPTAAPTTAPPTTSPAPTPTSSPTATSSPTLTPSPTASQTPAPSPTSSSTTTPTPSPSSSTTSPATSPTVPTPSNTLRPWVTPESIAKPSTTPSSTDELAYTGIDLWKGLVLAGALLFLGGLLYLIGRRA